MTRRSNCPINGTLELLGDRWSLLILRDMVLAGKQTFKEFQASAEGIATNVLTARLTALQEHGFISKEPDPDDRRRSRYLMTDRGKSLIPLLLEITLWGEVNVPGVDVRPGLQDAARQDRDGVIKALMRRLDKTGQV